MPKLSENAKNVENAKNAENAEMSKLTKMLKNAKNLELDSEKYNREHYHTLCLLDHKQLPQVQSTMLCLHSSAKILNVYSCSTPIKIDPEKLKCFSNLHCLFTLILGKELVYEIDQFSYVAALLWQYAQINQNTLTGMKSRGYI
ncbi:3360_t:CDS:2 [Entrophospora sp. SA101]|nr:3360_t:CDS:2 [Entrophospora sp. SA101]